MDSASQWHICACSFRRVRGRNKGDGWEPGIAFLSEPGLSNVLLIVDADHKPVEPYDYSLNPAWGAMSIRFT